MMVRTECLAEIAKVRGDALVVAVYSSAFEWVEISPHPLNFLAVGAMGQASSNALGFAIGLPDRKIIVLDGDGSLLMKSWQLGNYRRCSASQSHSFRVPERMLRSQR